MPARDLCRRLWGALPLLVCASLVVGVLGAAAAQGSSAAPAKTLRIAITQAAPDPFDPPLVFTNASIGLTANVFGGLTRLSVAGRTLPDLAKSWTVSKNGLVYTFKIDPQARFQSRRRVTAHDFVYSLNRAIDPKTASPIAFYLQQVKGYDDVISRKTSAASFTALNKSTLRIVLAKPQGNFLAVLSRPVAWAVDKGAVDLYGSNWSNPPNVHGTGAYRLTSRTGNSKFVFAANGRYAGTKGSISRVEVTVIQDPTAAVARYQSGEFDVVDGLTGASVLQARRDATLRAQLKSAPLARTNWLGMRTDRPPFNSLNVRLAFQHAIDKTALVNVGLQGQATPAKGWIPPGVGGNINKSWTGYKYDPRRARDLLARAGYPGGRNFPEISLYYTTQFAGYVDPVLQLIQQQLQANLGVRVNLRNFPRESFVATVRDPAQRPPMWAWTFGYDIPDASTVTSFFGLTGGPFNFEVWSNNKYNQLVNRALTTSDDAKRAQLFAQSELIRMKAAVVLPLYYVNQTWLVKPRVRNFGYANALMRPFNLMSVR